MDDMQGSFDPTGIDRQITDWAQKTIALSLKRE
jgi:hypothetical protein